MVKVYNSVCLCNMTAIVYDLQVGVTGAFLRPVASCLGEQFQLSRTTHQLSRFPYQAILSRSQSHIYLPTYLPT